MNPQYLDTLPETDNIFHIPLKNGEKVIFTAVLDMLATESGRFVDSNVKLTLTNQHLIADNGAGIWTVDVQEDIVSFKKETSGKLFLKVTFFSVALNQMIVYDDGKQGLRGFRFYFKKEDSDKFDQLDTIINHWV